MRTRTWVLLFAALALVLGGIVLLQSRAAPASQAEVLSDGELLYTLDLRQDGVYTVRYGSGTNTLEVKDGMIRVTDASCPDRDCVRCGAKNSGAPIVCLPNRLTIRFVDREYDGITQ